MLGPIVFGGFIDQVCDIWDVTCTGRGRCLRYHNDDFRWKLHGYMALAVGGALVFIIFAYVYARCTGCLDDKPGVKGQGVNEVKEQEVNVIYKPNGKGKTKDVVSK